MLDLENLRKWARLNNKKCVCEMGKSLAKKLKLKMYCMFLF